MKLATLAYGTLEKLQAAVKSGTVEYPTYCWLNDTLQYAFVNEKSEIEIVGLPKLTGTLDDEIILSSLTDGVYEVKGQHKIAESSETTYLSASYIIVIVSSDGDTKKVRRITADTIEDFAVEDGISTKSSEYVTTKYLVEHKYATEGYVDDKIAALEVTIEDELKGYVDEIIEEQIATLVPKEVDKYIQTVPQSDVAELFKEPETVEEGGDEIED